MKTICKHTVRYVQWVPPSYDECKLISEKIGIDNPYDWPQKGIFVPGFGVGEGPFVNKKVEKTYSDLTDEEKEEADEKQKSYPWYQCSASCRQFVDGSLQK